LHFAGVCSHPYDTFTVDGIKIGFTAFSPHSGTCQMNNYDFVRKTIKDLKQKHKCDIVIVSFHGGAEGSKHQHVPRQVETFLGYNRGNVYEFAHVAIDAGADLVLGHGPHVTRAVELYKDRLIAYSLGNFCTYKRFNLKGPNGVAPILKIWVAKDGSFIKAKVIPVYQDENLGTKYDSTGRVIRILQQLTKEDFPETKLKIDDTGWIVKL
jgi:2',3'-cyclic-nucleotide 2'-phosphodiesterase (5'-nucleotidase family)